ncbi:MAG: hypothetical protein ACLRVT_03145 [Oscillospiraceae bacterium]
MWYNIRVEREYLKVSLTGPKVRPVFGKAKPRNIPVGSKFLVQGFTQGGNLQSSSTMQSSLMIGGVSLAGQTTIGIPSRQNRETSRLVRLFLCRIVRSVGII